MTHFEFIKQYYLLGKPLLLDGLSRDWPCHAKWTYVFFREQYGDLRVKYNKPVVGVKEGKLKPPVNGEMLLETI